MLTQKRPPDEQPPLPASPALPHHYPTTTPPLPHFHPTCRPAPSQLGTGFDWQTGVVVVWGGLRGSVGLALALVVMHTQYMPYWGGSEDAPADFAEYLKVAKDLPCRDVPVKTLMLASWIVLLTVVINGSLMATLIGMVAARPSLAPLLLSSLTLRIPVIAHSRRSLRNRRLTIIQPPVPPYSSGWTSCPTTANLCSTAP